ncbi:MAG: hypothetical protein IJF84_11375 [Thermoguttaceae bacterium]|nr:hypothetical protein [Thermoguttaceae bacterium]MBQ2621929.1 hypothetical protein [Thermoguttaceae bacterium]
MTEQFDPYYQWLGIPQEERPINKYRLLALQVFESDEDVIANAADRQMAFIRTFQSGAHSAESQKLLNELSNARVTLLNKQSKAEYDQQLRQTLGAREMRSTPPPVPPVPGQNTSLPLPPLAPPASGQNPPSAAPPAPPVVQPPVQKLASFNFSKTDKSKEKKGEKLKERKGKRKTAKSRFLKTIAVFLVLIASAILYFAISGTPIPYSPKNETVIKVLNVLHIKYKTPDNVTPDVTNN